MELIVTFVFMNPEYSQKYADKYNFGKESENNWKFTTKSVIKYQNINEISLKKRDNFSIDILDKDKIKSINLKDMTVLEGNSGNEVVCLAAVSKKIIKKTLQTPNTKYNKIRFYFYLRSDLEVIKIDNNMYVHESATNIV